ncbi:MAG: hypothetical protein K2P51_09005 [Rhabdochlamydiaceae bacterium]|nr:hypothetical protein [Rhabdochlamydiaceae bacterium]
MNRRRCYHFLLLELLIAFTLFASCILPLTHIPMKAFEEELKTYQRLQLHRISDEAMAEVKAQLFKNEIPWEKLDVYKNNKSLIFQDSVTLDLKGLGARSIERTGYIFSSSRKKGKNQDQHRLVEIEIKLTTPKAKNFFVFNKKRRNTLSFYYKALVSQKSGLEEPKPSMPTPTAQIVPLTA